ncbi:unnamed protein product, partial [Hapterophycus canaliculatus]
GILHRAFPYASLSDLSFLETPSFVAGVTNPVFEAHPEWWDVLCQLDLPRGSGSVDRSRLGKDAALLYPMDVNFATKLLAGVKAGKGESWARCECHDYT